ncbi:MAG TPA: immunoglobulin domain-containing protein [Verrucomicrobiae bacterium]
MMNFSRLAVLLSSLLLVESVANAQNWQKLTSGTPSDGSAAISIGAGTGNTLFAGYGNNKGVFRSDNNGLSWTAMNSGLADGASAILTPKAFLKTSTGRIIRSGDTASWNNGVGSPVFYSDNNGASWTQAAFPFNTPSKNIAGTIVGFGGMVEHNGAIFASDMLSHGVWKSTDNGATWTAASTGIPSIPFFAMQFAYNVATDGTAVYAATPHWGIWRSVDNGATWQMDNAGIPGFNEALIGRTWISYDIKVTADGTVFAVVDNVVWRRDTAKGRWEAVSTGAVTGLARRLAVHGNNVYVSTTGPLTYETTDKGATWRGIAVTGLPSESSDILSDSFYAHNGALYFAATDGLYRTDLSATTYLNITPVITQAPKGGGVNEGKSFTFTVGVAGTGPFSYVWKNGSTQVGTGSSYTINSAVSGDAGSYTVEITGPGGTTTSTAVTLVYAPNAPGAVDYTYLPGQVTTTIGITYVKAANQAQDGSVYIGGNFDRVQGFDRIRLAKTDYYGNVDQQFVTGTGLFAGTGPTEEVFTTVPLPNGDVLVGGGNESGSDRFWRRYKPDGTVDYTYPWPIEINGGIFKAKLLPSGKVLVAGKLSNGIVRLNADGSTDTSWQLQNFNGEVRDFAIQADGKIILVGEFTNVGGGNRIARLNADGSVDGSFNPGTGASAKVYAVAVDASDRIYIGGNFLQYSGTTRNRLARLDKNGVLDTTFDPVGGLNDHVRDIAITPSGHVYIGGEFTTYNSVSRLYFARVTSTGVLDSTFPDLQLNNGGFVYSIEAQPDGHLLVGGAFTTVGSAYVGYVIRLLGVQENIAIVGQPVEQRVDQDANATFKVFATSTSALTYQWRKNGTPLSNGGKVSGATTATLTLTGVTVADEDVYDVIVSNGSQNLTSTGAQLLVNYIPVIEIEPVGGEAPRGNSFTFTVKARGKGTLTYQWKKGADNIPNSNSPTLKISPVTAADAGTYSVVVSIVGLGSDTSANATITVVEKPGLLENIFVVPGNGPDTAPVLHVGHSPDGKVYASGYFGEWSGDDLRDSVVRLNADGSTDTGFTISTGGYYRFAVLGDGRLIVADSLGVKRLNTNGTVDGTFNAGTGPNDEVLDFLALPDGKIILTGEFTSIGGQSRSGIVRLNSDGSIDNTFYAGTGFINGAFGPAVHSVVVQPDGKLLVGGAFTKYQGTTVSKIVRLNLNGTLDTTFTPPSIDNVVYSLALQPDGKIIAGGAFQTVGGQTRKYLARFNADGNVDTGFVIDSQFNSHINDVLLLPGGKIVVGGAFTTFSGSLASGVMRLNADGSGDLAFQANTGFGARLDPEVTDLALLPDGKIAVVGDFYDFDRQYRKYVAKLLNEMPALAFVQTPSSTAPALGSTLVLRASAIGTSAVSYQWYKGSSPLSDTGNISGSQTATLTITGVTVGNAGDYHVVITNLSGSQPSPAFNVTPITAPMILVQPATTNVVTTQTITLGVTALGNGTLTYQWYKGSSPVSNGGNISGAQTATLTIVNAVVGDSGSYYVKVTDSLGNTDSSAALVSVIIQPGSVNTVWGVPAFSSSLDNILMLPDGKMVVSGGFTTAGGLNRHQIAILNADGTVNITFAPTTAIPSGISSPTLGSRRLAVLPDGRILMSLHNGSSGGIYLYDNTGVGTYITSVSGTFNDIIAEPDGSFIVVGGSSINSGFIRKYRFNGTFWAIDNTFTPPSPNSYAHRIIRLNNGKYMVGGYFNQVNGQTAFVAIRLNANGSWDRTFNISNSHNSEIYAMAEELDGSVLIRGSFTYIGGVNPHYGFARYFADGTIDTTFNPNLPGQSRANARDLELQSDGKILAFGRGNPGIVRLNPDGTTDSTFDPGTGIGNSNQYIYAGALAANGELIIAGDFGNYNASVPTKGKIAKVNNDPVHLAFLTHPVSNTIDQDQNAQFAATTYGSSTISYQWLKNGQPLSNGGTVSGATTATLSITGAQPADDALYSLRITNLAGEAFSKPASLTVLGAPLIQINLSSSTNVIAGSNVVFAPKIKAISTATYTWRKNGNVVSNGGTISGASTAALAINGVQAADAGTYQLTIQSSLGDTMTVAMAVTVTIPAAGRDTSFRQPSGANHYVYDLALLPDGGALVGGQFTSIAGVNSNYFARLDANGTNVVTPGLAKFNSIVNYIWPLPSGKYLVGGSFTAVNDNSAYQRLVRLNADGSLDTTFQCPLNTTINAAIGLEDGSVIIGGAFNTTYNSVTYQYLAKLNANGIPVPTFAAKVNGDVNALILQADGKFVAAGNFAGAHNGTSYLTAHARMARFNANETLDTSYAPLPNATVSRLQLLEDGRIFALGSFTAIGGQSRRYLARLNTDGTADSNFIPPANLSATPTSFAVQQNGKVIISGGFTVVVTGQTHYQLARLNATGTLDTSFDSGTELYYNNNNLNYALSIKVAPDGKIWLAGQFNAYDGVTVSYLTRLFGETPDLSFIQHPLSQTVNRGTTVTFTASALGTSSVSYQWQKNGDDLTGETGATLTLNSVPDSASGVYRVIISNASGSKPSNPATLTVLGNIIISQQPQSIVKNLAQSATFSVTAAGALPVTYQWRKNGNNISGATGASYTINAVSANDAAMYDVVINNVYGPVISAGAGLSMSVPTAAGGTQGTLDTSFTPATMSGQSGVPVRSIDIDAQGRVYVSGSFTSYNSQTRNKFMRLNQDLTLDASFSPSFNGNANVTRFLPDGGFLIGGHFSFVNSIGVYGLARFNSADVLQTGPTPTSFTTIGENNSYGNGISVNPDGSYFLAGSFTTIDTVSRSYIAKIKADHTLDTAFVPSSYPNTTMRSAVRAPDGSVIASGLLGSTGDGGTHVGLVRYQANGTLDTSFTTQVNAAASGPVNIGFQSTGKIIVIGFFNAVKDSPSGTSHTRYGIARLNADGTVDTTFNAVLDSYANVHDMVIQSDDKIVIVGHFVTVNGTTRQRVARLNADGTTDTSFGTTTGASDVVYTVAQLPTGDFLIGGYFTSYGGSSRSYIARIYGPPPTAPALEIVQDPASQTAQTGQTVTFSVAAVGQAPFSFSWRKGTTPLGVTTPQLVLNDIDADDAGEYNVVVTAGNGSVTSANAVLTVAEPLTFTSWMAENGLIAGGNLGPDDDADGDGVKNIVEYVFGSNPGQSGSKPVIEKIVVNESGTDYYAIRAMVLDGVEDVEVVVTASSNIAFSSTIPTAATETDMGATKQVTVRSTVPKSSGNVFFRIVIRDVVIEP